MATESELINIEGRSCPVPYRGDHTSLEEPLGPGSLYLHLTSGCNLKCTYCYNVVERKRWGLGKKLPFEVALSVLRQAKEMGIHNVFITGGEPLLHPNALNIAEFAHELQLRVIFMTNGLLVNYTLSRAPLAKLSIGTRLHRYRASRERLHRQSVGSRYGPDGERSQKCSAGSNAPYCRDLFNDLLLSQRSQACPLGKGNPS